MVKSITLYNTNSTDRDWKIFQIECYDFRMPNFSNDI